MSAALSDQGYGVWQSWQAIYFSFLCQGEPCGGVSFSFEGKNDSKHRQIETNGTICALRALDKRLQVKSNITESFQILHILSCTCPPTCMYRHVHMQSTPLICHWNYTSIVYACNSALQWSDTGRQKYLIHSFQLLYFYSQVSLIYLLVTTCWYTQMCPKLLFDDAPIPHLHTVAENIWFFMGI